MQEVMLERCIDAQFEVTGIMFNMRFSLLSLDSFLHYMTQAKLSDRLKQ